MTRAEKPAWQAPKALSASFPSVISEMKITYKFNIFNCDRYDRLPLLSWAFGIPR